MSKVRFTLSILAVTVMTLMVASMASAQATRTWVSGVGDDVNPCSRTAPCKTFAGAISKTALGGEINAIDPGGFGTVTITKAITIDGNGTHASILAAGTTGVIINITGAAAAPQNDTVTLRNLSINGAGTGLTGVKILSSVSNSVVNIENCQIFNFRGGNTGDNGRGILDKRSAAGAKLAITNTVVRNNIVHGLQVGTDTGFVSSVTTQIDNLRSVHNTLSGAFFGGGSKTSIHDSIFNNNGNAGLQVSQQAGGSTEAAVTSTDISYNVFGIFAGSGAVMVRIGDVTVTGNTNTGISLSGGTVESFGNNNIRGNAAGNAPTLPAVGQQ